MVIPKPSPYLPKSRCCRTFSYSRLVSRFQSRTGMGRDRAGNRERESLWRCSTLHTPTLCNLWNIRALWTTRLCYPVLRRALGPPFHTNTPLYTGFSRPPVGDVGNRGTLTPSPSLISNSPELHSHDLENCAACQVHSSQPLRNDFHFSCWNDGYYCLFLYSLIRFPTTHQLLYPAHKTVRLPHSCHP